jgi:hypothetical protein
VVEFLDENGYGFVIVAVERKPIKAKMQGCRFTKMANGWQVGEFRHRPTTWGKGKEHRFVVVRRPIPEDPVEAGQLKLFKDTRYAYHVFITNLEISAWRVYLFYSPRAQIERHIRELAYDYPLAKVPTQEWIPNVAFFQLLLLGFDLVHYFKRTCLSRDYRHKTLKTLRMELLVLPGRLVKQGRRHDLRLPRGYHFQTEFERAAGKIDKLKFPKRAFL